MYNYQQSQLTSLYYSPDYFYTNDVIALKENIEQLLYKEIPLEKQWLIKDGFMQNIKTNQIKSFDKKLYGRLYTVVEDVR